MHLQPGDRVAVEKFPKGRALRLHPRSTTGQQVIFLRPAKFQCLLALGIVGDLAEVGEPPLPSCPSAGRVGKQGKIGVGLARRRFSGTLDIRRLLGVCGGQVSKRVSNVSPVIVLTPRKRQ